MATTDIGILLVSFGCSLAEVRQKTIDAFEQIVQARYPNCRVKTAFTSEIIRQKVNRQKGVSPIPNAQEALEAYRSEGIHQVVVVPTHIIAGEEYHKLLQQIQAVINRVMAPNMTVVVAHPLLFKPSDYEVLATAIYRRYSCSPNEAIVLVGHGSAHQMNASYPALNYECLRKGWSHIFTGTIEGYPSLDDVKIGLKKYKQINTVHLVPLMFVAGEHVQSDMVADSDSWANQFKREGYRIVPHIIGLGECAEVIDLYLQHVEEAYQRLCRGQVDFCYNGIQL